SIGYPDAQAEAEILRRRRERKEDQLTVEPITDLSEILAMRELVEEVFVHEDLERYMVSLVRRTREHTSISVGSSPRGALALMKVGRSIAAMAGRGFLIPDDVKACAVQALRHRMVLSPELWMRAQAAEDLLTSVIGSVPVPVVETR
ncbi:MAG: AAA family ATPase, partial [Spirochaetota bacterium]